MCGIIGFAGDAPCTEKLLSGLYKLEYRGYDSAGEATFETDGVQVIRARGGINALENRIRSSKEAPHGTCGIAHTRWATHGEPSDINAHPHRAGQVTLVHNGIIENYRELKEELSAQGYTFLSQTDTEVAAALIDSRYRRSHDPLEAIRSATEKMRGSFAFGILFDDRKNEIYGTRRDSPLLVGISTSGVYIASDITAFLSETNQYILLEDGETVHADKNGFTVYDAAMCPIEKTIQTAAFDTKSAELGGYAHFMIKEIHEESDAVIRTLRPRIPDRFPDFSNEISDIARLRALTSIHIVACGTAMHAGLYAKYLLERLVAIPVTVEIASEFRYGEPILEPTSAVFVISQSGETADTLAAVRLAKARGIYTLSFVNVLASSIARETDDVIYTYAGPEISVASTKAYTVQTSLLALFSLWLADIRGNIDKSSLARYAQALLNRLPAAIDEILTRDKEIVSVAEALYPNTDMFFIGRSIDSYIAMESALKLKEISYIHAEAYAAGELKHGTISLITEGTPVVTLLTRRDIAEKTLSNMREVITRGARVFLICPSGMSASAMSEAEFVFSLPDADDIVLPILAATATQLFAYHTAVLRGCSIDKPRNLAKSVTVE